ncbi:hypothetical protein REBECCA_4 [Erwinia phage Rebecca]|uniref:Uncharacterized protein n=1 Tax=Erwinia phage Rebecca TaxID=2530026 RepID=A0A482IFK1_9CAUD|nr:hypothetical protein REBECCA_4 [Erwinia phage Rebecca]
MSNMYPPQMMMAQGGLYPQQGMYPQQQMMQPPMMMQQQAPQIDKQALAQAFAKFIDQAATQNQNQLTAYIHMRYTQNQYQNQQFQTAVNTVLAMYMLALQTAPGMPPHQLQGQAVVDAYEIHAILELQQNPQMVQALAPNIIQALVQNIPRLQQQLNQSFPQLQLQVPQLNVPGYQLQNTMQPQQHMLPGYNAMMPPMQGYAPVPQQGMYQNSMMPGQPYNGYNAQTNDNLGMSDARAQLPAPPADGKYYGPASIGNSTDSKPANTVQPIAVAGFEVSEARVPMHAVGVLEEYSTPNLQQAMQQQQDMPMPSNIDFDSVMSLEEEENEESMFNIPMADEEQLVLNAGTDAGTDDEPYQSPFPSFSQIFGQPASGANISAAAEAAMTPPPAEALLSQPVANKPTVVVTKAAEVSPDGLPDGWMFTESLEAGEFLKLIRAAKRNRKNPLPIHYDRTFMTRLYRYNQDGAIEQRIVGETMDRLRHDLSSLDEVDNQGAREQAALFAPLTTATIDEVNKVVKEAEKDSGKVTEKLKEKDIVVLSKPVTVSCRQEAAILVAAKAGEIQKLNSNKHGYEYYYREAMVLQTTKNVVALLENPTVKALSQRSQVNNLVELAEAIRAARAEGALSPQALTKLTDHMMEVFNDMLTHDYGYAGELVLTGSDEDGNKTQLEDELMDFVVYMDSNEDHREVLDLIHKRWIPLRERLCIILTDGALTSAQRILAKRYGSDDDMDAMVDATSNMLIAMTSVSVTNLNKTSRELKLDDKDRIFAVNASDSPYLYSVLKGITERTKQHTSRYTKHRVVTADGRFLNFRLGGLGDGSVFIANFE